MPLTEWLPPATRHAAGFRITPIVRRHGGATVCVGLVILADPDSDLHLDEKTFDTLPVWDIIAQGPPSERLILAADAYKAADEANLPRARAVAIALNISEGAASNLIVVVRRAGLLPPTRPGVSAA